MTCITGICNSPTIQHKVGVTIKQVEVEDREVPAMVWYPASPEGSAEPYDYHGLGMGKSKAVYDAPMDTSEESYPLIFASHGIGMCAPDLWKLTEAWAAAGYIVVAPDHKDAAICHIGGGSDISNKDFYKAAIKGGFDLGKTVQILLPDQVNMALTDITYRSNETTATINSAVSWNSDPSSIFYGMIDSQNIGLAGHSLGAWDTFYSAGTGMYCEATPEYVCEAPPPELTTDQLIQYTCCNDTFRDQTSHGKIENAKALVGIGPGIIWYPNYLGLDDLENVQTMFITEALSPKVDYMTNSEIPYEIIQPPKDTIVLWSNHMTVSASIDTIPFARALLPGALWHNQAIKSYQKWTTALFDSALKGEPEDLDSLRNGHDCMVKEKHWED